MICALSIKVVFNLCFRCNLLVGTDSLYILLFVSNAVTCASFIVKPSAPNSERALQTFQILCIKNLNTGWGLAGELCECLVIGGHFGTYQACQVITYTL